MDSISPFCIQWSYFGYGICLACPTQWRLPISPISLCEYQGDQIDYQF